MKMPGGKTKICALLIFLMLASISPALAAIDEGIYTYLFRLYYDNGQLFADRDFEFKYDLIAEPFVQSKLSTATPYRGEVISVSGNVLGGFQFDPTVAKGKISVKGPYFSNAGKVNFFNDKGELLLSLSVSESSVCDENGVCNSDVGENYTNCPNDCKRPSPSPAYQPPTPPVWQNMLIPILVAVASIIAVLIVWGIIRKRKAPAAEQNQDLPPTQSLQ